jgi:hypothetical protein
MTENLILSLQFVQTRPGVVLMWIPIWHDTAAPKMHSSYARFFYMQPQHMSEKLYWSCRGYAWFDAECAEYFQHVPWCRYVKWNIQGGSMSTMITVNKQHIAVNAVFSHKNAALGFGWQSPCGYYSNKIDVCFISTLMVFVVWNIVNYAATVSVV